MRFDLDAMRAAPGRIFQVEGDEQIPTLDWRGEEVQVDGAVHAEASAFFESSSNQVILTVHVRGRVHRPCSRCLADVVEDVDKEEELEVFPDEIQGKYLELRPFIEAGMRLGLSSKPLCRPDCRGICPYCGADLNREPHRPDCTRPRTARDPRLSVLANLLSKEEDRA
ncbi:MAG: DUF177 domain-containing protein [Candidatus Bipolaricaulota bacterium]|nr:DUF177 domain-containing protein [Candidatus Bipolaricaulota bacterium]MDW8127405.1 DUF177 domain-containing protein [Candidatus Bipolaricaulota bacterium]